MLCDGALRVGKGLPLAVGSGPVPEPRENHDPEAAARMSAEGESNDAPRPTRVLIGEDWEDVAESMRILLDSMGCETHVARDGHAALAALRDTPLDLAILDIDMPGLDGWEVASRITQENGRPRRLVALTGRGQPSDRRRSFESGFDEHLLKPLKMTDLHRLLS